MQVSPTKTPVSSAAAIPDLTSNSPTHVSSGLSLVEMSGDGSEFPPVWAKGAVATPAEPMAPAAAPANPGSSSKASSAKPAVGSPAAESQPPAVPLVGAVPINLPGSQAADADHPMAKDDAEASDDDPADKLQPAAHAAADSSLESHTDKSHSAAGASPKAQEDGVGDKSQPLSSTTADAAPAQPKPSSAAAPGAGTGPGAAAASAQASSASTLPQPAAASQPSAAAAASDLESSSGSDEEADSDAERSDAEADSESQEDPAGGSCDGWCGVCKQVEPPKYCKLDHAQNDRPLEPSHLQQFLVSCTQCPQTFHAECLRRAPAVGGSSDDPAPPALSLLANLPLLVDPGMPHKCTDFSHGTNGSSDSSFLRSCMFGDTQKLLPTPDPDMLLGFFNE